MQNDENTDDTQVEQQEGETGEVEETSTIEVTPEENTSEARLAKAEAEAAKYRRLFEKSQKPQAEKPNAPQSVSPQVNVEETILLAQDVPEELIEELKLRASKYGGSLIKAQKDSNYLAVKERFEKDRKREESSLPASRGSSGVKSKKDFNTPGLTREEHMAMVKGQ